MFLNGNILKLQVWHTDTTSPVRLASTPGELDQQGCSKREHHFQQVVTREKGRVNAL